MVRIRNWILRWLPVRDTLSCPDATPRAEATGRRPVPRKDLEAPLANLLWEAKLARKQAKHPRCEVQVIPRALATPFLVHSGWGIPAFDLKNLPE